MRKGGRNVHKLRHGFDSGRGRDGQIDFSNWTRDFVLQSWITTLSLTDEKGKETWRNLCKLLIALFHRKKWNFHLSFWMIHSDLEGNELATEEAIKQNNFSLKRNNFNIKNFSHFEFISKREEPLKREVLFSINTPFYESSTVSIFSFRRYSHN